MKLRIKLLSATAICAATTAGAVDLEVMHWWTSGGEANAVAKFAEAWTATGNTWVDGAIAGGGDTARPVMVSRIIGGDPPAAFQFNHGRQAEELIEAGLLLDLTDVAEAEGWADIVNPSSLLDACTVDGRIYCAPVNIHSWQWMWLSNAAYENAGLAVPTTWTEFAESAPALQEAGLTPLAMGGQSWQQNGAFGVMALALAGEEAWLSVNRDKNAETVMGPEYTRVFEAFGAAREFSDGLNVQDWNQATAAVINDTAGAQIMGDWAQGEFAMAGEVAGEDYSCLPGLGEVAILDTGGDAFYFPKQDDPEIEAGQKELAAMLLSPEVQVSFNSAKGSLPVRGDVDLTSVNECTQKGLDLLANGNIVPNGESFLAPDTISQLNDLMTEFWNTPAMTAAEVQEQYSDIIASAE
ncbi:glucose/mannose transport system substrate-binding protein [Loktanella sp. DSM 29012]|uniref:Probable sugar-binding periplasmic protein n=1 Tax=Loktanella gaetbuli TaxID=2881335 RepID=A0ABS8BRU6_9RHOB|nr:MULTISPECIES: ABC transporter substrate-binding protein [Loktanella]MCB5198454.1 ABC transporter substrate-binding protein [Loktanella gaetbuli]SEQ55493.1 glucose/mannose transport system substrate-binding protein [Loktanella sp. DSM 29012]